MRHSISNRLTDTAPQAGVPALERGLDVMECLSTKPDGLGISELCGILKLPKNAVFRIAHALVARGYLLRDGATKRFRLSSKLLTIGQPRCREVSLVETALGPMRELREQTMETVQLGLRVGMEGVIIEKVEALHALRIAVDVGLRFPLHSGAPGKLFLAWQPLHQRAADIRRLTLERFTSRTITKRDEMRNECERILQRGYATDYGEADEGIHCVAAPVLGPRDVLAASIWVSAPARRMPKESFPKVAALVMAAAKKIDERLRA